MISKTTKAKFEKLTDSHYQPSKVDMETDINVPVTPGRLVKAVVSGGAQRRKNRATGK